MQAPFKANVPPSRHLQLCEKFNALVVPVVFLSDIGAAAQLLPAAIVLW